MYCSNCSRLVKPVVSWDIDGTLANYHDHLLRFVCRYWNIRTHYSVSTWSGAGNFEDYIGITQEQYREAKLAFRQGGMKRTMPLYKGAREALEQTQRLGAEVWLCTTRPWQRLDNVDPDTKWWLEINRMPFDGLLYGETKYQDLCSAVDHRRVVAVIDDLPEQCDAAADLGLPVMQRANTHNGAPGQQRSPRGNLEECALWAADNILKWNKDNGGPQS